MIHASSLLTLLLIGIFATIAYITYKYVYVERFVVGEYITFLDASETADFIRRDPDAYIKNLSPTDLYARKVGSPEEYTRKAANVATNFSTKQKERYARAARDADAFLRKARVPDIDLKNVATIPWVIGLTSGATYEDGLPHTRANIIFMSTDVDETPESLVQTLVHEKLHLYQRLHPDIMMACLERRGFKRWKQRMGEPRVRANPDVDPWIYIDPVTREPMVAYYATDKPVNITDVVLDDPSFEHPYEKIAYDVAQRLNA